MLKQVILVRQDLKLPKGKLAVQVAHASLGAATKAEAKARGEWMAAGAKKVALKVQDEESLLGFARHSQQAGLPVAIIRDAGKTVLEPGTLTAVGIGPAEEARIDAITGALKCY